MTHLEEVSREYGWATEFGPIPDLESAGIREWRRWDRRWLTYRTFADGSDAFYIEAKFAHPSMIAALAELTRRGWKVSIFPGGKRVVVAIREDS